MSRLLEIKARLEWVDPSSWLEVKGNHNWENLVDNNLEFIKHSPDDIRWLIQQIQELQDELARCK